MKSGNKSFVFLIRMWLQGEHTDGAHWRGSVHDVESGQVYYVTGARDAADFIDAQVAERGENKPGSP